MTNLEIVEKFTALLEESDYEKAGVFLSNDFRAAGATAEITKEQFIGAMSVLLSPFPDHRFNFSEYTEKDQNTIIVTFQEQGTHTIDLDLNPLGIPVKLPATQTKFLLPKSSMEFTIEDDKISSVTEAQVDGAGLRGILSQLGIELP